MRHSAQVSPVLANHVLRSGTVLVVEDETVPRLSISKMLNKEV
jgi:hypothetical protein